MTYAQVASEEAIGALMGPMDSMENGGASGSDHSDQEMLNPQNMPNVSSMSVRSSVVFGILAVCVAAATLSTLGLAGNFGHKDGAPSGGGAQNVLGELRKLHEELQAQAAHAGPKMELPEGLGSECKLAFREHVMKLQQKAMLLMGEAMNACQAGLESEPCKKVIDKAHHLEEEVESECRSSGTLCTITTTDKEGDEKEEECIPAECHDELEKIEEEMSKAVKLEESEDVPECKDFECKIGIECPAK